MKIQKIEKNTFEAVELTDEELDQIVGGQVQLKEDGPGLVKPAQTLSLTCTVSGLSLENSSVKLTATVDSASLKNLKNSQSNSKLKLFIDGVQMDGLQVDGLPNEDTTVYYCATGGQGIIKDE